MITMSASYQCCPFCCYNLHVFCDVAGWDSVYHHQGNTAHILQTAAIPSSGPAEDSRLRRTSGATCRARFVNAQSINRWINAETYRDSSQRGTVPKKPPVDVATYLTHRFIVESPKRELWWCTDILF